MTLSLCFQWVGLLYSMFDMATTVAALANAISNDQDQGVSVLLGLCALFGIFGLGVDTFILCKFCEKDPPESYPPGGGVVFAVFGQDLSILCVEIARGRGMLSTQSPVDVLCGAASAIGAACNGCKVIGTIIRAGTLSDGITSETLKLISFLLVTAALGLYTAGRWVTTADTDEDPGMYALFALFQVVGFVNLIVTICPQVGE